MTASPRPSLDAPYLQPKDNVDQHLHDLANALAATRSFGEVMKARAEASDAPEDRELVGLLLKEVDRASELVKRIRQDARRPGDVLECQECGYEFVNQKTTARRAACRRCGSERVAEWAPSD